MRSNLHLTFLIVTLGFLYALLGVSELAKHEPEQLNLGGETVRIFLLNYVLPGVTGFIIPLLLFWLWIRRMERRD